MSLFRLEVIEKKRDENIFGDVVLVRPVSFTIYTILFLIFACSLALFLFFGHYSNKQTVSGVITHQSGLVKVYAPQRGIVINKQVNEGDYVNKGDVIYSVSTARHFNGNEKVQIIVAEKLENSVSIIQSQIVEQRRLAKIKEEDIQRQIDYTGNEIISIEKEINLHQKRVKLYEEDMARLKKISKEKYLPEVEYTKSYQIYLDSQVVLEQLKRSLKNKNYQKRQLQSEFDKSPIESDQIILNYEKSLSELQLRLTEIRSNQNYTILAPSTGQVTSLVYKEGDTINPELPLLTILPTNAALSAELYVPTRAAGFLKIGQEVKLRFEAFPYQKFGLYEGIVEQISGNIIIPGEIVLPVDVREPVYKVSVKLREQKVMAFGREHYLQVGMLLQGDIVRDHSRIIQWVLEPLYSLRGHV